MLFHWQFYYDVMTCMREGFGFLLYLVYPFPLDLYFWLMSHSSSRPTSESVGGLAWDLAGWVRAGPGYAVGVPTKTIEAFNTEVKIQEEILKIGKERARELFSDPVVVLGP